MPSGKKRTHEEFIKEFQIKNTNASNITILGSYVKNNLPIECVCNLCNTKWYPTPKALLNNHKCPKCTGNMKHTHNDFIKLLSIKNPHYSNLEVIGRYVNISSHIKCKCKICGCIWEPKAGDLIYSKSGCPYCSGNRTSKERFLKNLKIKNKYYESIELLEEYSGVSQRIKCKCKICGFEWNPIASSLMQGTGCPNCAKKRVSDLGKILLPKLRDHNPAAQKMTQDEFIKKFREKNPYNNEIKLLNIYDGINKKIKCLCLKCNNIWSTSPNSLLRGSRCPKCSHSSTSFMEQFFAQTFMYLVGKNNVLLRDKSLINKELDIFIPSLNLAIEPGSWKWHKKIIDKDLEKIELCRDKSVRLIIIYDSCVDDIQNLHDDIYYFNFDIGSEKNHSTLKQITNKILSLVGLNPIKEDTIWKDIERLAYFNSQKVSNEEFINKFKTKNKHSQDITLLSKYTRATDYIKCKCKKCGNVWQSVASELLREHGCPKCQIKEVGINKRKIGIIKDWKDKNPSGNKLQCEKETGISRTTIYKWWNKV